MNFSQGDIIKVTGLKGNFVIVSKNAFINSTNVFHVCPLIDKNISGPLHIFVRGKNNTEGTVICEQVKLLDLFERGCSKIDRLGYGDIMNISDAIQGVFEYD